MDQNPLDRPIDEYFKLKMQIQMLSSRLEVLNKQIKESMFTDEVGREHTTSTGVKACLQIRQSRPKPDEGLLEQLIESKGLWDECKKEVVDHNLVEQAYIEGKLTDDDLRSIGAETTITTALIVEEVKNV